MNENSLDLTDLVPEFPEIPQVEIPRDALVSRLARSFSPNCLKQIVISDDHYGKTNLLSQFCRHYASNSIGYFITSNPLTQNYRNFLYVICNQISKILGGGSLPVEISEGELKNIYPGLSVQLAEYAKRHDQKFYIVIDGIEEALNSETGSKILNNPPILLKSSPYLLLSATLSTYEKLPEQLTKGAIQCPFEVGLQFNYDDTLKYLSDLGLTTQDIKIVNEKSKGVAGYLAVLRDSIKISGKNLIYTSELPDNLRKLITNQIEQVFKNVISPVREIIEILAVAPKPVSLAYIQEYFEDDINIDQLCNTGMIVFDSEKQTLSLKLNLARQVIREKTGKRGTEIKQKLLEVVRKSSKPDNELLTLLLEELNDYHGLVALLETDSIRKSFDSGEMSVVIERMRKTAKLALETHEIEQTSRWVWGIVAIREFLAHASTTHEVNALIAIGESQKALKMAYNFPETISKIRLLARVYSSMKDKNEHVSMTALDELEVMINEEDIEKLEKEVVQDVAIDILPILPDKAVALLEKVIGEPREQNLIDVAISSVKSATDSSSKDLSENTIEKRLAEKIPLGKLARFQPAWLQDKNLAHLLKEIDELENTKAKEYMIRQWCLQNTEHDELSYGIELWLETVIRDENFIISLRSLRQLSELLKNLTVIDRRRLVDRFKISAIASLRSPWEEWVGFHLNIVEAIADYDPKYASDRAEEVYNTINMDIEDFDIKVFCYARLWGTYQKIDLTKHEDIKNNLERVLTNLLENSALQDEILNKTLRILAGIDIEYALEVADRLNTVNNRKLARKVVLINGYIKNSQMDLSNQLKQVLKELDAYSGETIQ